MASLPIALPLARPVRPDSPTGAATGVALADGVANEMAAPIPPHAISPNLHLPPFGRPGSGRRLSLPALARSRTDGRFPGYTGGRPPEIEPVKVNHADQLQLRSPRSQ
jgi:hypothetical protein